MAHPMAGQAKSSQKARLKRLGGKAGKSWGSSSMYKAKSLPGKNAGSSTPMTISGGSSKKRPDRMAAGGAVGGRKRHPHATTNIIISHAGGRGGSGGGGGAGPNPQPTPVPVPRPVPVPVRPPMPVGAGGPPPGVGGPGPMAGGPPPMGAIPPRPPIMPPAAPPPGAGLPMRPPGMKAGGGVKKAAKGGFLKEGNSPKPGDNAYPGFPHSPTTKAKSTVSAHASGGAVKKRAGGGGVTLTKKLEFGGGTGLGMGVGAGPSGAGAGPGQAGPAGAANAALGAGPGRVPLPPQQGAPNISGRQAIPFSQPNTVPLSGFGARNFSTRPAPGTTTTFAKKGGSVPHDDEAQDKKLFERMYDKKEKAEKKASGGGVGPGLVGYKYRTNSPKGGKGKGLSPYSDAHEYHQQGKGYADGGNIHGAGSAVGRMARNSKVPAKTEL